MQRLRNVMKDKSRFEEYKKVFLEENLKHNLISKNDENFLWEKHYFDSISIGMFLEKYKIKNPCILDIGCGGGFPCVPVSIEFPEVNITGIDSIRKKINSVETMRDKLGLKNLKLICDRVENLKEQKFDIIISRAVADLGKLADYALPLLKKDGYFVAYKSKKALEEIEGAKTVLEKYNAKVIDILEYQLPMEEVYERNLVVICLC